MVKIGLNHIEELVSKSEDSKKSFLTNVLFNNICKQLKVGISEVQLLEIIQSICEMNKIQEDAIQRALSLKAKVPETFQTEFLESDFQMVEDKWPDEMVYKIYCRDNLEELPLLIIAQMRDYIQEIFDRRSREVLLNAKINNEKYLR